MNFFRLSITMRGGNLRFIYLLTAADMLIAACVVLPVTSQAAHAQGWSGGQDTSSPNMGDALPLLDAMPPNFLRVEAQPIDADRQDNYLDQITAATGGRVFRFASMPIAVHINAFPDNDFMTSVRRGLQAWQAATQGAVVFKLVDDPTKARIEIAWKHLGLTHDASNCDLGAHTITKFAAQSTGGLGHFIVNGIPVAADATASGQNVGPPQVIELNLDLIMRKQPNTRLRLLQNVVTHECGHALGLLGHSCDPNDMMYAITDEHSRLSRRDIQTLIRLYQQKADVVL